MPNRRYAASSPQPRAALEALPAYVAGRSAARGNRGVAAYKISSNENPYPPLPSVLEVIRERATDINRYPDMGVTELTAQLATRLQVPAECIAVGPGSVGVLGQILTAMCEPGDEVLYAWRSFEAYPILTALAGGTAVPVPVTSQGRHDLRAMAAAITERTAVVLICTPNNPTGPTVGATELREFVEQVPPSVLVVLDEAYHEFVTAPDAPDALSFYRDRPNVAVLRTFSKAYGLAGLRVGYAVARAPITAAVRKSAIPFGVSSLAQTAAIASLGAHNELELRVNDIVAQRERLVQELRAQGWSIPESQGNFVWFEVGDRTEDFAHACEAAGLSVRPFAGEGVRATVGEPGSVHALLKVAAEFAAAGGNSRV